MRQFVTWGFWLSLVALVAMVFGLVALVDRLGGDETADAVVLRPVGDAGATASGAPASGSGDPAVERDIDLIALVDEARADPGFGIVGGVTTGTMQIRVDALRSMTITAGTPGENRCAALDQVAACAVAADLLGEAVLWFSIVPLAPRNSVSLPEVVELRDGGTALLANGWIVAHAPALKRNCDEDTTSFSDFQRRFREGSVTSFSLDEQRLVAVTCAASVG
ncbi:MAG: hypothetical protein RI958_3324 [Actinomycetota bacterium]|jgi:hypothetical protein